MSTIRIFSHAIFGKWKQQARILKRKSGIPHHAALEDIARKKGFQNWHHLSKEAEANQISETAYRSGLVVAYDSFDVMDDWHPTSEFVEDHRVSAFCEDDVLNWYRQPSDDEAGIRSVDVDPEEFMEWQTTVAYFRYCGKDLPSSEREMLRLLGELCLSTPMFLWFRGAFLDPWRDLTIDGVLDMS